MTIRNKMNDKEKAWVDYCKAKKKAGEDYRKEIEKARDAYEKVMMEK